MSIDTSLPSCPTIRSQYFDLPEQYNGWVLYDTPSEDTVFEYWADTSTHTSAEFTRIVARPRPVQDELWLITEDYDQFGHVVNKTTHTSRSLDRSDWIWDLAKRRMDRVEPTGEFDTPPSLPTTIGQWELVCERHEKVEGIDEWDDATVWEWGFGDAELVVEETDIISNYAFTRRPHTIRYREPDSDPEIIVSDVSRKFAFEIATNTLRELPAPLSRLSDTLDQLQSVKGIGPAKSRQLVLLGITSLADLSEYIERGGSEINHYHTEAIDTVLTSMIRNAVESEVVKTV